MIRASRLGRMGRSLVAGNIGLARSGVRGFHRWGCACDCRGCHSSKSPRISNPPGTRATSKRADRCELPAVHRSAPPFTRSRSKAGPRRVLTQPSPAPARLSVCGGSSNGCGSYSAVGGGARNRAASQSGSPASFTARASPPVASRAGVAPRGPSSERSLAASEALSRHGGSRREAVPHLLPPYWPFPQTRDRSSRVGRETIVRSS